MVRRGALTVFLLSGCSIEPEQAEAAQRVAHRAFDKAGRGLDEGADHARRQWDRARRDYGPAARRDWGKLKEAAGKAWKEAQERSDANGAEASPLPDRWWTKAREAVQCPQRPEAPCRVEAWFVRACQRDPMKISNGLQLTPVYDPARAEKGNTGVEVRRIAVGSVLDELGFEDGDELRSVNGLRVADPMSQVSLYAQLRDQRRFEVVFARNAELMGKTIEIVDAL